MICQLMYSRNHLVRVSITNVLKLWELLICDKFDLVSCDVVGVLFLCTSNETNYLRHLLSVKCIIIEFNYL